MKGFRRHPISLLLLFTILAWALAACGGGDSTSTTSNGSNQGSLGTPGAYTCVKGSITASGSSTLARLIRTVVDKYVAKCSGSSITVNSGGSKTGLADVEADKVAIGNSDIYADKTTQADLVDHQVAVAAFAIIINAKVGVKGLTTAQIKDIYSGKATNWKEVGGPDMKIVVVDRPPTSGTRATFEHYILGGPETVKVPANLTSDRNGTVRAIVQQNEGAIGYASPSSYDQETDAVVATIDGNAPTADLIKNNTYKFWNIEHMYTKGKAKDLAQALIDYTTSSELKDATTRQGFIALSDMDQAALKTHQPAS
jgi:phosphate transport system substrate-binding protein